MELNYNWLLISSRIWLKLFDKSTNSWLSIQMDNKAFKPFQIALFYLEGGTPKVRISLKVYKT